MAKIPVVTGRKVLLIAAAVLAALCISSLGCAQVDDNPTRKVMDINISGNCSGESVIITIFDRTAEPVFDVDIEVQFDGKQIGRLSTDVNGVASFIPSEAGEYKLMFSRSRYRSEERLVQILACGNCSDGVKNGDEEKVDCGGRCEPCTTTTTTTTTTSTTTTTTTSSTSTTTRTTTTRATTTTTSTTTTTTTTTKPEESGLLGLGTLAVVLVVAIIAVLAYFTLKNRGEPGEEAGGKGSIYDKHVEATSKRWDDKYKGFKAQDALERQMLGLDEKQPPKDLGRTVKDPLERQMLGLDEKKQPAPQKKGEYSRKVDDLIEKQMLGLDERGREPATLSGGLEPKQKEADAKKKSQTGMDMISDELESLDKLGDDLKELRENWQKRYEKRKGLK